MTPNICRLAWCHWCWVSNWTICRILQAAFRNIDTLRACLSAEGNIYLNHSFLNTTQRSVEWTSINLYKLIVWTTSLSAQKLMRSYLRRLAFILHWLHQYTCFRNNGHHYAGQNSRIGNCCDFTWYIVQKSAFLCDSSGQQFRLKTHEFCHPANELSSRINN